MRGQLREKLNDDFDPTDADTAMSVAWQGLRLMETCQRVLWATNHGLRIGRDDSIELAVRMRTLAGKMGLLSEYATGAESDAFHRALAPELTDD
jgi:hypothetical protein